MARIAQSYDYCHQQNDDLLSVAFHALTVCPDTASGLLRRPAWAEPLLCSRTFGSASPVPVPPEKHLLVLGAAPTRCPVPETKRVELEKRRQPRTPSAQTGPRNALCVTYPHIAHVVNAPNVRRCPLPPRARSADPPGQGLATSLQPSDVAASVYPADSAAKCVVESFGSPSGLHSGLHRDRYPTIDKSKIDLKVWIDCRIALPGLFEGVFVNRVAHFSNKLLHFQFSSRETSYAVAALMHGRSNVSGDSHRSSSVFQAHRGQIRNVCFPDTHYRVLTAPIYLSGSILANSSECL